MALGQGARKRLKALKRQRTFRDAMRIPNGPGELSAFKDRWADPSRAELRLLRRAVERGWVPEDGPLRQALVDSVAGVIESEPSDRRAIAAVRVIVAMDEANLNAIEQALPASPP